MTHYRVASSILLARESLEPPHYLRRYDYLPLSWGILEDPIPRIEKASGIALLMKGLVLALAMMPTPLLIDDVSHFLKVNTGEGREYIRGPVLRVTGIKISLRSTVENFKGEIQRSYSKKTFAS